MGEQTQVWFSNNYTADLPSLDSVSKADLGPCGAQRYASGLSPEKISSHAPIFFCLYPNCYNIFTSQYNAFM